MQEKYIYFILGIILGIGIAMYIYETYKQFVYNRTIKFTSKKMLEALSNSRKIMVDKIIELKRELTEEEKNKIIEDCYNDIK